ncbi:hypothetical protein [Methylobacterium gnaphalii]|uniref:Rap1a immunity protein domain-containing protein n=1 Tax=Methylobacterium gnaphalii TaxID=1010610 RepID=A0A512JG14_9HYPH|nr:hypothetical protein [Methylobacterium gnaphalii]GEP08878.1 hypothetical protein MGN01_07230 [Methylobacterium gnaphalii]GJD70341.1 hypothetical protein MMMDOFMJ_3287 [Methylobacterium gnaphalii]GLS47643.1 hypothetical protein GCM10007885_04870 [Methylobacterium gnaphalii]
MMKPTAALLFLGLAVPAQAQVTKIVGIGASPCSRFNQDIGEAPAKERDYLAWAQGFMSGALIRAPEGVDGGLDLTPSSMPLNAQADFLRSFCTKRPDLDFMDAVHALYRHLRTLQTL